MYLRAAIRQASPRFLGGERRRIAVGFTRPAGLQHAAPCKVLYNNATTSEFEPRLAGSGASPGWAANLA
jgi:hypothetical protein